jgi:hypothetical protein
MLFGVIQRISLMKNIPEDLDRLYFDNLVAAACNFCTAVIEFLTIAIEHIRSNLASKAVTI